MDSPCIKQTVCKVLNIFQCGKYLVAYVLKKCCVAKVAHCTPKHNANFHPPSRTDRRELPGGGVGYTFFQTAHTDLEIRGIEGLWLDVNIKEKILVGKFYRR